VGIADEQLVVEALSGSQSAFREIVHRFERPVFNLVARMVHDRGLAEDLSQDAFVKAYSRLDTYQPEQGKFSNWLFKIAHNTAIDHLRRRAIDTVSLEAGGEDEPDYASTTPDPSAGSPFDSMLQADLAAALSTAIERLRPEYREAMVLRHQEGLAYEEIAEIMELPLGTVKTYLHRARKELAGELSAAGWGPAGPDSSLPSVAETHPPGPA